ncbi:MAG: hypothetical protein RL591_1730 [Planctomycetota bacterium]
MVRRGNGPVDARRLAASPDRSVSFIPHPHDGRSLFYAFHIEERTNHPSRSSPPRLVCVHAKRG